MSLQGMSAATFTSNRDVSNSFMSAVAQQARTSVDNVVITHVTDVSSRKQTATLQIDFYIVVVQVSSLEDFQSLVDSLANSTSVIETNFNSALNSIDPSLVVSVLSLDVTSVFIPSTSPSPSVSATATASVSPSISLSPSVTPVERKDSEENTDTGAIAGGVVGGAAGVLLLGFAARQFSKSRASGTYSRSRAPVRSGIATGVAVGSNASKEDPRDIEAHTKGGLKVGAPTALGTEANSGVYIDSEDDSDDSDDTHTRQHARAF